ncbi:LysR substrate-binding domain-containing protein [Pseudoduganella plicata]|uniref:LysR family transcriptional regulator n=1 Tax=Pseudoduganella plicata TaxID=321984 RepID=A0A4V1AU70_9BURK|nr:LysR substrate-binding domain-containing protein [Pseudoduganella plicata]QBQ38138.1 LysR family transcriptional regulator [Pseudoduganella plicata]GGZ02606.1 LysR family transcriptional regulator [Pseudoduganella plicata]
MRRITFDLDTLRSFVTGVEMGSFARAADRLGKSTSAMSGQLKKLEDQLGMPVLRKSGRGLTPTAAGESLLAYARRLLELNDEAAAAVRGVELAGSIRLGMQEDFGEHILTDVLGRFTRAHPRLRIEARVARHAQLMDLFAAGQLDLALTWDIGTPSAPARSTQVVDPLPMRWIGPASGAPLWHADDAPLPLVMMDAPCLMRSAATAALDRAGIPWRVAFTSASLGGVWAAVAAGLGVTVRTALGVPAHLRLLDDATLPALPAVGLGLHCAALEPAPVIQRLHDIVLQTLAQYAGPTQKMLPSPHFRNGTADDTTLFPGPGIGRQGA